ncbi:hypothetical protein A2U01_0107229, partial [Trifolium medium]|nr:hypothetical protein [Trifolium medium]
MSGTKADVNLEQVSIPLSVPVTTADKVTSET